MHRSEDSDRAGKDCLPGELPAQPRARFLEVEGRRGATGRGLLRAERTRQRETDHGKCPGVHPNTVPTGSEAAGQIRMMGVMMGVRPGK